MQNVKCFFITFLLILICSIHLHAATLKWDASTGDVSGYTIYYGLSQDNYPFSENVGNVTQYSLDNFSLSEGTTYYFVVRAYNDSGESENSTPVSYTVPSPDDTTPPLSPEGVSAEIISGTIRLTWDANSEADMSNYNVYYGTSSRTYGLPIARDVTEYSVSNPDIGVTYYFAVTAVDTSGNESGFSNEVEITNALELESGPPTSVLLTSDLSSPQAVGTQVTFTAQALGGTGNYEYKFWVMQDGKWRMVQDYSSSQNFVWTVTDDIDNITVWSRNEGSSDTWQVYKEMTFNADNSPPTSVSLASDLPSPQPVGTQVTFTAQALGGTGNYEYKFWVMQDGKWRMVQDYSSSQNFVWNLMNNIDYIVVWSRSAGSNDTWQIYKGIPFKAK
jgi:fibronectin type III domain protein